MTRSFLIGVVLATVVLVGCHTSPTQSWGDNEWRGFSYREAREFLSSVRNVFLVCITEDHVEELDPTKPSSWSVLCFQGTVVVRYKGDWSVGEKIKFAHSLDSTVKKQSNTRIGDLVFVFTDVHTNAQFGLETGEFEWYDPRTGRLLKSLLPEKVSN